MVIDTSSRTTFWRHPKILSIFLSSSFLYKDLPPLQNVPGPTPPPHYMMGGLPGGRKRFEAILAKSRSLPNSAAIRQMNKKPKPPYTTPRMASTILEHDVRPENEMLGQKSISDLSNRRLVGLTSSFLRWSLRFRVFADGI